MSGSISIITNFALQQAVPIDTRLVATNSSARLSTPYPYVGLKVYQTDNQLTYTYIGNNNWIVEERGGIYGGSGSLVGDTFVDFGTTSNVVGSQSYDLVWQTDSSSTTKSYLFNNFVRHTDEVPDTGYRGVEFRQQFKYFSGTNLVDSAYISLNPPLSPGTGRPGSIAFSTGFGNRLSEKVRITNDGNLGIATNDPKGYIQIGTSSATMNPLVLHNSNQGIIGYNWYSDGVNEFPFNPSKGQTKLVLDDSGTFRISNRRPGLFSFENTFFTTGTASGRVGIRTTNPQVALDVNGQIRSNSLISGATVSSDNRVVGKTFTFSNLSATYFSTAPSISGPDDNIVLSVRGTQSFRSNGISNTLPIDTNIVGDLGVFTRDLTVYDGSITNFESSTVLTPDSIVYYSTTSGTFSNTTNLTNFTYSISAYRVGALVNLTFEIETTNSIPYSPGPLSEPFFGIMFKISSSRFVPVASGYGSGFGGNSVFGFFHPVIVETFQSDPTSGGALSQTGSNFWLRIRTTKIPTITQGQEYLGTGGIGINNKFKGSITYKSGNIPTITPPSPPPVIVVPGEVS